jgi:hypothetical protein
MPTELEEVSEGRTRSHHRLQSLTFRNQLVGFIAHPNPQVRALAIENLVPYSTAEPAVFKTEQLQPVKNLRILVRDHPVSLMLSLS